MKEDVTGDAVVDGRIKTHTRSKLRSLGEHLRGCSIVGAADEGLVDPEIGSGSDGLR